MTKSTTMPRQARVQKVCTLWTHDDNFSRDEIVLNAEKFPEISIAPGSLLQIVALSAAVRDFKTIAKGMRDGATQVQAEAVCAGVDRDVHAKMPRRESMTVTIDENGSTILGGRDVDAKKAYVFVARPFPPNLRSKHPNLQISISEIIAKEFGFRNRMQVVLSETDEYQHEAHHIELVFRDEYLTRADMWRLAISELSNRTIYRNQKLVFMNTIKTTIKNIYIDGRSVHSGYFSPETKPIFRSESARFVLFIQMSREMWDFDAEGAGEIMFNKVVNGFLPDLFKRWLRINARHSVTIILFTRMQYDGESPSGQQHENPGAIELDFRLGAFRDYYHVVVSDMASGDWINILYQLKKEFRTFLREVSLVPKSDKNSTKNLARAKQDEEETIVAGRPSSASQGNILEAINLAAAQFSKDYVDRDLIRTGISVIIVTPGTGVFEVDHDLLKLTTDTLIGSGIGIDLVSLSPMPLHSVPLFRYRIPQAKATVNESQSNENQNFVVGSPREDEKTPRQHRPDFGSLLQTATEQAMPQPGPKLDLLPEDASEVWRFAMPYWIDISFWSGISEEFPELMKPRNAEKPVTCARKKDSTFSLRCRLYELQMMGIVENDLGQICIPYLFEDDQYPFQLQHAFKRSGQETRPGTVSKAAPGGIINPNSYPSQSDKDHNGIQMYENRAAHKTWMEAYDEDVFSHVSRRQMNEHQHHKEKRLSTYQSIEESLDPSGASRLSLSSRSSRWTFEKTRKLVAESKPHSWNREWPRHEERQSPTRSIHQYFENKGQEGMRPYNLQRYETSTGGTANLQHSSFHLRVESGRLKDYSSSLNPTPFGSPTLSREPSPVRRPKLPSTNDSIINSASKSVLKSKNSSWFLRSISFGANAEAAKLTVGDATTDISQGEVKPAKLTVGENQKGAIAERLVSTRSTVSGKPSQPIMIRVATRAESLSNEKPSLEQSSCSAETTRATGSIESSIATQFKSTAKDPGSTFFLAGSRALGDHAGPRLDSSSGIGTRDIPKTLSPTSAIAPWVILVNPCNPKKNAIISQRQYRKGHHVFPQTRKADSVKWKSLCSPASVPLTDEWFPSADQLATEYNESPYRIIQNDEDDMSETLKGRSSLIKELIAFRLSHGYQIIVGSSVAEFSGKQEKSSASILDPEYMSGDGDTIFMSSGSNIHQLVCVAGGEVEVRRYSRKPGRMSDPTVDIGKPVPYEAYIRTALEPNYRLRDLVLYPLQHDTNWNIIDTFLAGYNEDFSEILKFWRARFVLIPTDMPITHRRAISTLAEDSEEEIRLEGIRKLTQMWQKSRYISRDEQPFQPLVSTKQKDPNPLAIEYYTRDPSAIVAAGLESSLLGHADGECQSSIFPDADKYHTSGIDVRKLAEDLQGEKGIQMIDRRWHLRSYNNCFLGFDLTSWLLSKFQDIATRDEAVEFGNELMKKGLFQHVQKRHQFRDGNFFFQIAAEYRTPRVESRTGWFGIRKTDKSVPVTPTTEAPRTLAVTTRSIKSRPNTASSSSSKSDSVGDGERTPTQGSNPKPRVALSRVMRYDLDPRKRSYRPEVVFLHYDCIHNPDNCYHIRIDWMNVTAKLIEDAIATWASSAEKYGLKLVELPINEAANIIDRRPFRSPYTVKVALQPSEAQTEVGWDSAHPSPQCSRTDKFMYHKALLRKLNFVLDMEAAEAFPADVEVTYSWGQPDYKYTQFIHRSGNCLAQITSEGHFLLLANRLASHRAKDHGRLRPIDSFEHKKTAIDGSSSCRIPSTPTERPNPYRSPFASPLARPVQESSLLHTALVLNERSGYTGLSGAAMGNKTPNQIKDEVEKFCSNKELLSAFYKEAFKQAPSPSPRMLPVLDEKIPNLGLPPSISIREASPATTDYTLNSTFSGKYQRVHGGTVSEMSGVASSSIMGRRQAGEGSGFALGRRGSIMDTDTETTLKLHDNQERSREPS